MSGRRQIKAAAAIIGEPLIYENHENRKLAYSSPHITAQLRPSNGGGSLRARQLASIANSAFNEIPASDIPASDIVESVNPSNNAQDHLLADVGFKLHAVSPRTPALKIGLVTTYEFTSGNNSNRSTVSTAKRFHLITERSVQEMDSDYSSRHIDADVSLGKPSVPFVDQSYKPSSPEKPSAIQNNYKISSEPIAKVEIDKILALDKQQSLIDTSLRRTPLHLSARTRKILAAASAEDAINAALWSPDQDVISAVSISPHTPQKHMVHSKDSTRNVNSQDMKKSATKNDLNISFGSADYPTGSKRARRALSLAVLSNNLD